MAEANRRYHSHKRPTADSIATMLNAFRRNRSHQRIRASRAALAIAPDDLSALTDLAEGLIESGELDEAASLLERGRELDAKAVAPVLARLKARRAEEHLAVGQAELALAACDVALELVADEPTALAVRSTIWRQRADHFLRREDFDAAAAAFRQVGDLDRVNEVELLMTSRALEAAESTGAWEQAVHLYHQLTELVDAVAHLSDPAKARASRAYGLHALSQHGTNAQTAFGELASIPGHEVAQAISTSQGAQLTTLRVERQQFLLRIDHLTKKSERLQDVRLALEAELTELARRIEELIAWSSELERERDVLHQRQAELERDNADVAASRDDALRQLAGTTSQLEQARSEIATLDGQRTALSAARAELEAQAELTARNVAELESTLDQRLRQLERRQAEIESTRAELSTLTAARDELRQDRNELAAQVEQLTAKEREHDGTVRELRRAASETHEQLRLGLATQLEALDRAIGEKDAAVRDLRRELTDERESRRQAVEEHQALRRWMGEQIEGLQAEARDKDATIGRLRADLQLALSARTGTGRSLQLATGADSPVATLGLPEGGEDSTAEVLALTAALESYLDDHPPRQGHDQLRARLRSVQAHVVGEEPSEAAERERNQPYRLLAAAAAVVLLVAAAGGILGSRKATTAAPTAVASRERVRPSPPRLQVDVPRASARRLPVGKSPVQRVPPLSPRDQAEPSARQADPKATAGAAAADTSSAVAPTAVVPQMPDEDFVERSLFVRGDERPFDNSQNDPPAAADPAAADPAAVAIDAQALLREAARLVDKGDAASLNAAAAKYREAAVVDRGAGHAGLDTVASAFGRIGEQRLRAGVYGESIAAFDAALQIAPNRGDLHQSRGLAHLEAADAGSPDGDHSAAIADLDRAVQHNPDDPNALAIRAQALRARFARGGNPSDLNAALEDYGRALSIAPTQPTLLANRAACLLDAAELGLPMGDVRAALSDLNAAVSLSPNSDALLYERAATQAILAERDSDPALLLQAVADLDQAVQLKPELALYHFARANLHYRATRAGIRPQESGTIVAEYSRAIELAPERPDFYIGRAQFLHATWMQNGQELALRSAVSDYSSAIQLDPNNGLYYAWRSRALADQGETERAAQDIQRARELDYRD